MNRRTFAKRFALSAAGLLIPRTIFPQIIIRGSTLKGVTLGVTTSAGGGGSNFAFLVSTVKGSTDGNGTTSSAIDTTGASFLVLITAAYQANPTPTDSKGNTYIQAITSAANDTSHSTIWYCSSPVVGTGHTFSIPGSLVYPVIGAFAFSGGTGGILDQSSAGNNAGGFVNTVQPGSITPGTANQLVVSSFYYASGTVATVDSGLSTPIKAGVVGGQCIGGAGAYIIQTSAGAINPTWTMNSADFGAAAIASFK